MTGGQMAPTTLPFQKTTTTPRGRDVSLTGYPLHVSEMLATIEGVSFVVRCSVDSYKNIMETRKMIEKAFKYQIEGKGFSLVEILSPCPTDWGLSPLESVDWIRDAMMKTYKLGIFRDRWKNGS